VHVQLAKQLHHALRRQAQARRGRTTGRGRRGTRPA
jgi:hypothetical protein